MTTKPLHTHILQQLLFSFGLLALFSAGCSPKDKPTTTPPQSTTYSVGGTVNGLNGTLVLQNSDGESVTVSANGAFTLSASFKAGDSYNLTVATTPAEQTCSVARGQGTVQASVSDIAVTCQNKRYSLSGNVTGLNGTLVLQNGLLQSSETLSLTADGAFTLSNTLEKGSAYNVTIATQPAGQTCEVARGQGVMGSADISDMAVTCRVNTYTLSGHVTGLIGAVVLQNGTESITVNGGTGDIAFSFQSQIAVGQSYAVTLISKPAKFDCTLSNAAGTLPDSAVTNITVQCTQTRFSIGGTVSGLDGTLVIQNSGQESVTLTNNGAFAFSTLLNQGSAYQLTLTSAPALQDCVISSGMGSATSDVTDVQVTCTNLAPQLTNVTPTTAHPGDEVTLTGVFHPEAGKNQVLFDTTAGTITQESATQIKAIVPNESASNVTVKVRDQSSAPQSFHTIIYMASWSALSSSFSSGIGLGAGNTHRLSCPDAATCLVITHESHKFYSTTNGGMTFGALADPPTAAKYYYDLSCPSSDFCVATGLTNTNQLIISRYRGGAWDVIPLPMDIATNTFGDVTYDNGREPDVAVHCNVNKDNCVITAVMTDSMMSLKHAILVSTTMNQATPILSLATISNLGDLAANAPFRVHCGDATHCMINSAPSRVLMTEASDLKTWSVVRTNSFVRDAGVFCYDANNCLLAGSYIDGNSKRRTRAIYTSDKGAHWTESDIATFGDNSIVLNGLSCSSSKNCTVIGYGENNNLPSAIATTPDFGRTWRLSRLFDNLGFRVDHFSSLSCPFGQTVCYTNAKTEYGTSYKLFKGITQ